MTGKRYVYAAMQLAHNQRYEKVFSMMEEDSSVFDPKVVELIFNQLTIKAALKLWGNNALKASEKEMKQLHWRNSFQPVHWNKLSDDQRKTVLESHIFLQKSEQAKLKPGW